MENIKPFSLIAIVCRDESGIPYTVQHYPFIAEVPGSVIYMARKPHFKYKSAEDEFISIVLSGEEKDVYATLYRAASKDCYVSRRDAEAALRKERIDMFELRYLPFMAELLKNVLDVAEFKGEDFPKNELEAIYDCWTQNENPDKIRVTADQLAKVMNLDIGYCYDNCNFVNDCGGKCFLPDLKSMLRDVLKVKTD